MVAAAAGRVAGSARSSMKIKGTLDTSNIDRGFSRVKKGFEGVKGQAKSFGSDMARVAMTVSGLAKKLIGLGIAGTTAMVGIASRAPAVAPALAKMGVEFGKLTRSLGEALAPAFERVAGWMGKVANWVDQNQDKIREVSLKFFDWAEAVGEKLWPHLEKLGNWAADHPGLFAGIVAGLALGPSIIGGIASITGLIATLTGATISTGVLTALAYIAAIGTAGVVGSIFAQKGADKLNDWMGIGPNNNVAGIEPQMTAGGWVERFGQKAMSSIKGEPAPWEDPLNPNSPAHFAMLEDIKERASRGERIGGDAMISAAPKEDDRRWNLMQWWDSVWS